LNLLKRIGLKAALFINGLKISASSKRLLEKRNAKVQSFLKNHLDEISEKRIEEITVLSASELAHQIRTRKISSREATLAYSIRAATVGVELCLVNDVRFEEALIDADKADQLINNTEDISTLPPLIGLPFSIKDVVRVKGLVTTLGYQFLSENLSVTDSHAVEIIKKAGAIIYCLTNVPQGLFAIESSNNVFGAAQNPWDRLRTPGGSSGGCAGLVASFSSPISFCGDIGGSTRIPAHFNGLYGIKPSAGRITVLEQLKPSGDGYTGFKTWLPSPGCLARSFDDVLLFSRTVFGKFHRDIAQHQRVFNEKEYEEGLLNSYEIIDSTTGKKRKAKIGIVKSLAISEPFDELQESIEKIKTNFQNLGHETFDFNFDQFTPLSDEGTKNILHSLKYIELALRGDPFMYYYKFAFYVNSIGEFRKKIDKLYLRLTGEQRLTKFYDWVDPKLSYTIFNMANVKKLEEEKEKFYTYMRENQIDAIIMPVLPFPAAYRGNFHYQFIHLMYTMTANMLNLSGGAVPIKVIEKTDYNTTHKDRYVKSIRHNIETGKGLPFGIQVATLPNTDEKCLRIMKEVDDMFKFSQSEEWSKQRQRVSTYTSIKALGK
jgi:Asp-tRNA(Asn)/Glu-tRNA(Gln) amidotransferase A subunit family amidase